MNTFSFSFFLFIFFALLCLLWEGFFGDRHRWVGKPVDVMAYEGEGPGVAVRCVSDRDCGERCGWSACTLCAGKRNYVVI